MAGTKPATLPPLFVEQLGSYLSAGKPNNLRQSNRARRFASPPDLFKTC
jgi:hypothetical protein